MLVAILECSIKKDESITFDKYDDDYTAMEIVSPVLHGVAGLLDVVDVLRALHIICLEHNELTGLHVHVSGCLCFFVVG